MSVTITIPEVSACGATRCTYNVDGHCHAHAITIGDSIEPMCDTFVPDAEHVEPEPVAGVGACKVVGCALNRQRSCQAASIRVALHDGHPDCMTFQPR